MPDERSYPGTDDANVLTFPQKLCCQCDQKATKSIRLIDGDDNSDAGSKYFCDEHFPKEPDQIKWARINDEPFEYAIQQGPHGDEFVKLLNGECLKRPLSVAQAGKVPNPWANAIDPDARTSGDELGPAELIRIELRQAMLDCWNSICADTDCHPLDIKHQGKKLFFTPDHWSDMVAWELSSRLSHHVSMRDLISSGGLPEASPVSSTPSEPAQCSPDPVQDTWLVGGPDLKGMSGSVESNRVVQLHFRRPVTDADRKWLLDAINAKIEADGVAFPSTERGT